MNELKININGKDCVLTIDYMCLMALGAMWNLPGYKGVVDKLATFGELKDDVSFEQFNLIGDVIEQALFTSPANNPSIDRREIMNMLVKKINVIGDIVLLLINVIQENVEDRIEAIASGKMKPASKKN